MTVTATTNTNTSITLIKYWGEADESPTIPMTSSLLLTLGGARTTTTVSLDGDTEGEDAVTINGTTPGGMARKRVVWFLNLMRPRAGMTIPVSVTSSSTVPLTTGLVSSAVGFAALATTTACATSMCPNERALSRLTRRGSGPVTRSIFGGLVLWSAGVGSKTFYAEPTDCDLAPVMVVVVVSVGHKAISSTQTMRHIISAPPPYPAWAEASREDLWVTPDTMHTHDLPHLGEVVEGSTLETRTAMIASRSLVIYQLSEVLGMLHTVCVIRDEGFPVWATIDADPSVEVLATGEDADRVAVILRDRIPCATTLVEYPGDDMRVEEITT